MAAPTNGSSRSLGVASAVSTRSATMANAVATTMLRMPWATPKWGGYDHTGLASGGRSRHRHEQEIGSNDRKVPPYRFQCLATSRLVTGICPQKHAEYPFPTSVEDPYTPRYPHDKATCSRDRSTLALHSGTVRASSLDSNEWFTLDGSAGRFRVFSQ
jgi:hypothetical protein